ncbi:MAG: glycosidase, partial [Planctomycetes bacterium]|nr:glycosidase [Planctomycetota bacterium]
MKYKFRHDVVRRFEGNPLITIDDIPFPCNTVFNAACAKHEGQYILLLRVEDLTGRSVFALARSDDGYNFELEDEPVMTPCQEKGCFMEYEKKGIEDPRITKIDGIYYIMYTAVSPYGPLLALAKTEDFKTFDRIALVSQPENKDGVLFPEKVNGKYARLDRPVAGGLANIWISYSDDLIYWGDSRCVMTIRDDHWDSWRIGASTQPIRI